MVGAWLSVSVKSALGFEPAVHGGRAVGFMAAKSATNFALAPCPAVALGFEVK